MHFFFITLFPNLVAPYFADSILRRAADAGLVGFSCINPRDFSLDAHKKTDDYKCSGGAGLVMTPQPLFSAWRAAVAAAEKLRENGGDFAPNSNLDDVSNINLNSIQNLGKNCAPNSNLPRTAATKPHTIALCPAGKKFTQNDAKRLAQKPALILVCGRYEGLDERFVEACADEVFSVGDFVLTGGELAALCVADAVSRNVRGVLGNAQSLAEESFEGSLLEAPSFTKPAVFENSCVISAFLKGNHNKIAALKSRLAECKTAFHRPDLLQNLPPKSQKSKD